MKVICLQELLLLWNFCFLFLFTIVKCYVHVVLSMCVGDWWNASGLGYCWWFPMVSSRSVAKFRLGCWLMNALVHFWYLWALGISTFNISTHTSELFLGTYTFFWGWIGSWLVFQGICHWLVGLMKDWSLYQCLLFKQCTILGICMRAPKLKYHKLFSREKVFYYTYCEHM